MNTLIFLKLWKPFSSRFQKSKILEGGGSKRPLFIYLLIYFIAYAIIIETIIVLCSFQFLPASLFSISPNLAFSHLVQSWTLTQEAFLNYLVTSGHRLIFKGKVLKKKKSLKVVRLVDCELYCRNIRLEYFFGSSF